MNKIVLTTVLLGLGCRAYKLEPPPGFAEVSSDKQGARLIGGEHVGLHLRVYDNVPGGTLTFWSQDLVRKLGERKYALTRQTRVESRNGVEGSRFDFDYVNPDGDEKFYSVVVFVTNEHLFALQMAGDAVHQDRFRGELDKALKKVSVRGCRPWGGRPCRGPQPPQLDTPPLPEPDEDDGDDDGDDGEPAVATEPEAEERKGEAEPKSEAKPKAEAKPKSEAKPKAEAKPKSEAKPKAEARPKAKPKAEPTP